MEKTRLLFIRSLDERKEHQDAGDVRINALTEELKERLPFTTMITKVPYLLKLKPTKSGIHRPINFGLSTIMELPNSLAVMAWFLLSKEYRRCTHVWMHPFTYSAVYMMPFFRLLGKRVIFDYNDDFFRLLDQYAWPYRAAGVFLFKIPQELCPYLCTDIITTQHMAKRLGKRFEKKILVLPAGYNRRRFAGWKVEWKSRKELHVGYFGLIGDDFDITTAVKSFAKLKIPNATLHLYGRVDPRYTKITHPKVKYEGLIPHEKVPAEMVKMDILLNTFPPSTLAHSASPGKVFEYMSIGGTIISADLRSVDGILKHGHNALLYKPGDVESFTEQLKLLAKDPALRKRLGENAYKSSRQYGWDMLSAQLAKELKKKR